MGEIAPIKITPLKCFESSSGSVMHALKSSDPDFVQFGEAYFSTVNKSAVKGWKRHKQMIANLIVPSGSVKFVLFDSRLEPIEPSKFEEVILSRDNYVRLTIPPGIWFAFQGLSPDLNLILNIASVEHDPNECEQLSLVNDVIPAYEW